MAGVGGTSYRERFWKKYTSRCREIRRQVKQVMTSFRCYDNSDVIVTSIITNFLFYVTHLWWFFLQVSVKGNVVNAQTWVILPMKNRIEYVIKSIISCCWLASPQTSFGVRLSRIHFSPTRNECVTNEPQRTSAGRLVAGIYFFSIF